MNYYQSFGEVFLFKTLWVTVSRIVNSTVFMFIVKTMDDKVSCILCLMHHQVKID